MLRSLAAGLASVAIAVLLVLGAAGVVSAVDIWGGGGCDGAKTDLCEKKKSGKNNIASVIRPIIEVLLYISTIVSIIVIVTAGIRYATSGGDSGKVTSSKNTLMYAVVGFIVSILALAIIQFAYSMVI